MYSEKSGGDYRVVNSELSALKDSLLGFLALGVAGWVVAELHALRKSIEALNVSLAQLLEKQRSIEYRVEKLEERVRAVELCD